MNKCEVLSFLLLILFAPLILMTLDAYATAVVWTDKADYANWETATIYGSGFSPNTNVDLTITRPDSGVDTGSTTSDAFGSFTYYYVLNGMVGTYTVTATDGTNTASTTFTESDHVDWVHGRDDTDNNGVVDIPMVTWHTGAINAQNSILTEGNIVPPYPTNVPGHVNYRAIIEDKNLGPGTYELTIQYEFTKGGKVAFDFLTTNYGITDSNLDDQLPGWADSSKINSLVTTGPSTATFPNDGFSLPPSLGDGTVALRQSAHDTVFAALNPRKMKLYGATITGITQGSHSGLITGDSDATVAITFTKSTDETWPIIATWGGHLGIGAAPPAGYGAGNGAGSVSGAPFHMSLGSLVNTQTGKTIIKGKRDLAVQIGAITPPPGTGNIVVEKITLGGVDTFDFVGADTTLPSGFSSFSITIVTPGVAVSTGFTNVNPGTYKVTEQALAGWDLTGITIIDPDDGSSYTGSTATLDIDSGEIVTVTFTNTKRGKIIVDKITVPAADPQSFSFDASGPNSYSASFSLTDAQTPWNSGWLKPGSGYSVIETVLGGWDLTSVTVNGVASSNGASLTLNPGQILYVNFTDTKRGHIIVHKTTVPPGDPADFTFDPDYQVANFVLSDGEQYDSAAIMPGTYHVQELAVAGWDLTGLTVADPSGGSSTDLGTSTATIGLAAGETVHVYYTNTKRGKIIVDKITVPASDPQSFDFLVTGPSYSDSFSLTDVAAPYDSGWIKPGNYAVSETVPAGWVLTSAVCSDGSPVNNIILDPGETVIVTFTDERALPGKASIGDLVWKDLDGDGLQDTGEPGFQGVTVELYTSTHTLGGTTTTDVSGSYSFTNLDLGNYYLKFYAPSGYVFSPQDQGTDDAKDSDANPSTGQTAVTTLTSGETDNTWDAGMYEASPPPQKASIGDFVWEDVDGNGIQDVGETGIQGVTVKLYDSGDNLVATTTTSADGSYGFTNLNPGDYYLELIPPTGYIFTLKDQGLDDIRDSDVDPSTGKTIVFTLGSGMYDRTWDVGLYKTPPAPIGGVWIPINKFELLAPWVGLISLISATTTSTVYIKRKIKRKKKQN